MNPAEILIKDFTYELPPEKIAQFPLKERDSSKLLIYNKGKISHDIFRNIAGIIPENSLLIFNDTKVINARLKFQNPAGKEIEVFTLEPEGNTELVTALSTKGSVSWVCLVGNLKAWKSGTLTTSRIFNGTECRLEAELISKQADAFLVKLSWQPEELTFAEILEIFGQIPLPPYMKRDATPDDMTTYQTVYSESEGSVAAPTAGLHFTHGVLDSLKKNNIKTGFVTLHIGAGTFKPVKTDSISEHDMHSESIYIELSLVEEIAVNIGANRIIAVGTTSMRTVESLYWFGVQLIQGRHKGGELNITQWEPYENEPEDPAKAFQAIISYMKQNNLKYLYGKTNIIIVPGYDFKVFSGIITNFHQPQSTLLLLIAAFIGSDWKGLYEYALNNDFRFLSYGDSSLLLK
ncbi:MAG TPA: S-adenosylmethionine:tRNA ribosyltransferase-isomerase [Ignavibacteria bacterium]|nr:S-adenosylmethionine:tRNA ribosyltransferase-isomerase [Ignavibacteria bacterium]